MNRSSRAFAGRVAWWLALPAILYFLWRDVPRYADYSAASYLEYWPTRGYLVLHVLGAGVGILAGLLQFSATLRRRWPAFHRRLGWAYVAGALLGAPAALGLAAHSSCVACRPALGSLAVYWFCTTLIAFVLARRRDLPRHRDFMLRSFVAMNVFVIVRFAYMTSVPGLDDTQHRIAAEYLSVFMPLLGVEMALAWRGLRLTRGTVGGR